MTTGGIDESLPRPSPSRFGSSDHALVCLPDARPNGAHSSVCLSAFEHPSWDSLLAAWIPGVQWVTIVVLRWRLASFEPETPKTPGEANACLSS